MRKEFSILDGPLTIRYKGTFDFEGLYKFIHRWFMQRQLEYKETLYKDKVDSPWGNEVEINAEGERKVTDFVKYKVTVSYHMWESKDIMVPVKGKEVKRTQGRIEIKLDGKVTLDWQNKFNKHPLLEKFLVDVLMRRDLEAKYFGPLDSDVHGLAQSIKGILGIEAE